jgi:hypothetical protein
MSWQMLVFGIILDLKTAPQKHTNGMFRTRLARKSRHAHRFAENISRRALKARALESSLARALLKR